MTKKEHEQEKARESLRKMIPPGTTVYTMIKSVSRSGMSRKINAYIIRDNEPVWISPMVAKAVGYRFDDKTESIVVEGCGMDMGFHLVNSLSYALHGVAEHGECEIPTGYSQCPGMNNPTPEHYHAGYSLKQKWM